VDSSILTFETEIKLWEFTHLLRFISQGLQQNKIFWVP